jgi:hypothetical protein
MVFLDPYPSMFLVVETANTDRPPIGFCIDWLLGSKYAG